MNSKIPVVSLIDPLVTPLSIVAPSLNAREHETPDGKGAEVDGAGATQTGAACVGAGAKIQHIS